MPNWKRPEYEYPDDMEPMPTMREQIMKEIVDRLRTTQLPVTITAFGKPVTTYFPDGSFQNHDDWRGR